jgi:hypothetical protein
VRSRRTAVAKRRSAVFPDGFGSGREAGGAFLMNTGGEIEANCLGESVSLHYPCKELRSASRLLGHAGIRDTPVSTCETRLALLLGASDPHSHVFFEEEKTADRHRLAASRHIMALHMAKHWLSPALYLVVNASQNSCAVASRRNSPT